MICLQTSKLTPVFRFHRRHCAKKKAGHGFSQKKYHIGGSELRPL